MNVYLRVHMSKKFRDQRTTSDLECEKKKEKKKVLSYAYTPVPLSVSEMECRGLILIAFVVALQLCSLRTVLLLCP